MNKHQREFLILTWCLPLCYIIHLCEEFYGGQGLAIWFSQTFGTVLTERNFLMINFFGMLVILIFAISYTFSRKKPFLLLMFWMVFFINGIAHVLSSLITMTYSPGLISSILIYIPLGYLTYVKTAPHLPKKHIRLAALLGFALMAMVFLIAINLFSIWEVIFK